MQASIKHIIVAVIAAPLFLSFNKEEISTGTNTQADTRSWHKETAWSGGAEYTQYYPNNCIAIYTSNNSYAGTAHFSRAHDGKVTISIALSDGWELTSGNESIKIQDYASQPKSRAVPKQFAYKGNNLTVEVNASNYYGIQLEVQK